MIQITINDFLKLKNINKTQLAYMIGCSISMLSKIQNNQAVITKDFMYKFNKVFPNYQIVNGVENWKQRYIELNEEYNELYSTYKIALNEIRMLKNAIHRFNDYCINHTPKKKK